MNENIKNLGNIKYLRDKYQADLDILKSKYVKT